MDHAARVQVFRRMLTDLGTPISARYEGIGFWLRRRWPAQGCSRPGARRLWLRYLRFAVSPSWNSSSIASDLKEQGRMRQIGSPYRLPFEDSSIDVVLSDQVFEHVLNYPQAIAELRRITRPGGSFCTHFPAAMTPRNAHSRASCINFPAAVVVVDLGSGGSEKRVSAWVASAGSRASQCRFSDARHELSAGERHQERVRQVIQQGRIRRECVSALQRPSASSRPGAVRRGSVRTAVLPVPVRDVRRGLSQSTGGRRLVMLPAIDDGLISRQDGRPGKFAHHEGARLLRESRGPFRLAE